MRADEKNKAVHLGFLTALGDLRHGVIGGFLVLNMAGRPAEFHCTSPVRPNRAQEILYGETLKSFVYGEQIAPALVGRAKLELVAVLTNDPNMLSANTLLNVPLGIVLRHVPDLISKEENISKQPIAKELLSSGDECDIVAKPAHSSDSGGGAQYGRDCGSFDGLFFCESLDVLPFVPGVDYTQWRETICGKNRLALPTQFSNESLGKISFDGCVSRITPFFKSIDSVEPFERIRLAVEEAQKSN